ncbi:hypothetical protein Tco_1550373, partial [Tanacetum coccineum]
MANLPPPNHVADLPEDDPEEQPKHYNFIFLSRAKTPRGPCPSQAYDSYLKGNINGWILEDDEEEEEEEDPEMEEEMEEENDDDDAEL